MPGQSHDLITEVILRDIHFWAQPRLHLDGSGVTIAVVDTGIQKVEVLGSRGTIKSPPGSRSSRMNVTSERESVGTHGTQVALLLNEIAPRARIIDVKAIGVYEPTSESNLLTAIHLLIDMRKRYGIPHIINLSVGVPRFCDGKDDLAQIVNLASNRDILVITSAGNYGSGGPLSCPGCAEGALTVGGAVRVWDSRGNSSQTIYAQSSWSHIKGKPDLIAPARIPMRTRMFFRLTPEGPELTTDEPVLGTSFAAPFVSGVAALLFQKLKREGKDPFNNTNMVRSRLLAAANDSIVRAPRRAQGAGLLEVRQALGTRL